jgi:methylated-DNA-[protein]-cysteine S-methyltransferase
MKKFYYYRYKFCNLFIAEENNAVCCVSLNTNKIKKTQDFIYGETPLLKKAAGQLDEYFGKKRKKFNLPLALHGTDFQIKVWKALQNIPYGKTCSYGHLAGITGNSKAGRAVGMANNRNPIMIIIPCHRVIGKDGSLTGYAGGLKLKKKLLELEQD